MGEQFFPDGLSGMLRLIGRERVAQGCQTAPLERLGSLGKHGAFPALPGSRDVYVQVAGGIDAEDEPLMEQQVRTSRVLHEHDYCVYACFRLYPTIILNGIGFSSTA